MQLSKLALHQIDGQPAEEMPVISSEELHRLSKEDTQYEITVLEEKRTQMKPNMAAIAEYRKKASIGCSFFGGEWGGQDLCSVSDIHSRPLDVATI